MLEKALVVNRFVQQRPIITSVLNLNLGLHLQKQK